MVIKTQRHAVLADNVDVSAGDTISIISYDLENFEIFGSHTFDTSATFDFQHSIDNSFFYTGSQFILDTSGQDIFGTVTCLAPYARIYFNNDLRDLRLSYSATGGSRQ